MLSFRRTFKAGNSSKLSQSLFRIPLGWFVAVPLMNGVTGTIRTREERALYTQVGCASAIGTTTRNPLPLPTAIEFDNVTSMERLVRADLRLDK